jgi:signal peptidase I
MAHMDNSALQTSPVDSLQALEPRPAHRFRRATFATLLSLLFPGLGQVYNRQPRKGLAIAVTFPILTVVLGDMHVLLSFWGLVVFFTLLLGWRLFIVADAARAAWTGGKSEARFQHSWFVTPIFVVLVILCSSLPTPSQFLRRYSYAKAFKVPSSSMCPTICAGERVVADMSAYRSRSPQRGELVLLKLPISDALFTKRVVGIAGDTVEAGPLNEVLVNGTRLIPPEICGTPVIKQNPSDELPYFPSTRVPQGSFFVVGDNLANSNDSRYPEFGLVRADQLQGKPLFLYWSPGHSRIGCRTQ